MEGMVGSLERGRLLWVFEMWCYDKCGCLDHRYLGIRSEGNGRSDS